MPKISVDTGWDPVGESWVSIAQKLILLNQTGVVSYNQLNFGHPYSLKRFSVAHALTSEDYNLDSICRSTGWKPKQLYASFINFFLHFDISLSGKIPIESIIKVSRCLRVCPICFDEGIHLTFHQCLDFRWCPLHCEPLTNVCPRCSSPLADYAVSENHVKKMRIEGYLNCRHCNTGNLGQRTGHKKELQRKKADLVSQYAQWCRNVSQRNPYFLRRKEDNRPNILWQSDCDSFTDIKYITQLYECPRWLEESLYGPRYNGGRKISQFATSFKPTKITPVSQQSTFALQTKLRSTRSEYIELLRQSLQNFQNRLLRSEAASRLGSDYPYMFRGRELVTWRFSKNRSAIATAFTILQWAVDYLTDPDNGAELSEFWGYWSRGPAQYAFLTHQLADAETLDHKITKELSALWFHRVLTALFKTLLFHSAAQGGVGKVPVFHTPSLVSLMRTSSCMPMFILAEKSNTVILEELNVFSSLDTFTDTFSGKMDCLSIDEMHNPGTIAKMSTLKKDPCITLLYPRSWLGYDKHYSSHIFKK